MLEPEVVSQNTWIVIRVTGKSLKNPLKTICIYILLYFIWTCVNWLVRHTHVTFRDSFLAYFDFNESISKLEQLLQTASTPGLAAGNQAEQPLECGKSIKVLNLISCALAVVLVLLLLLLLLLVPHLLLLLLPLHWPPKKTFAQFLWCSQTGQFASWAQLPRNAESHNDATTGDSVRNRKRVWTRWRQAETEAEMCGVNNCDSTQVIN